MTIPTDCLFLAVLSLLLILLLSWGFARLPGERWQMLAAIPWRNNGDGSWQGINLTYYGLFLASGQTLALCLLLILLGASGISTTGSLLAIAIILVLCLPAARIIAILVEKKRHTFTVGGASFVGIVMAPWVIVLIDNLPRQWLTTSDNLPVLPTMAAMALAYTLGEGLGRLGCISFGCCYGKPLKDCHPLLRRLFGKFAFTFAGSTKKAIYAGGLAGEPLFPIQAITCILYCLVAVFGSFLFLRGQSVAALVLAIVATQLWRIVSETLRADFRGFSNISAYQKMGAIAVLYVLAIVWLWPKPALVMPAVDRGLAVLWQPGSIIGLQLLWLVFFLYFGRSTVTSSRLSFDVVRERV